MTDSVGQKIARKLAEWSFVRDGVHPNDLGEAIDAELARERDAGWVKKEGVQMKAYSEVRIESGIRLAQEWYEGWKLDDLEPSQILEAIEKGGEHGPYCDCQTCADAGEGKWQK